MGPVYHDPVRSSKGHFVETSGLRWLDAMPIVPVPWAGRLMALPVLTALVHSERLYADSPRIPKALLDAARQMILQICRWLRATWRAGCSGTSSPCCCRTAR